MRAQLRRGSLTELPSWQPRLPRQPSILAALTIHCRDRRGANLTVKTKNTSGRRDGSGGSGAAAVVLPLRTKERGGRTKCLHATCSPAEARGRAHGRTHAPRPPLAPVLVLPAAVAAGLLDGAAGVRLRATTSEAGIWETVVLKS